MLEEQTLSRERIIKFYVSSWSVALHFSKTKRWFHWKYFPFSVLINLSQSFNALFLWKIQPMPQKWTIAFNQNPKCSSETKPGFPFGKKRKGIMYCRAHTFILSAWPLVFVWVAILWTLQIFVNIEPKLKTSHNKLIEAFSREYLIF